MEPVSRTCPHCRAPLAEGANESDRCPSCGRALGDRPRKKRPLVVSLLLAIGLLGVIGGAVLSVLWQVPAVRLRFLQSNPAASAQDNPLLLDPPLSPLALGKPLPGTRGGLLRLGRTGFHDRVVFGQDESILAHEIVRQAVLEAGRTGLGAIVRDEAIGELAPEGSATPVGGVGAFFGRDRAPVMVLARGQGFDAKATFSAPLGRPMQLMVNYEELVASAEKLAHDELPKALKELGLAGAPLRQKPQGPVPDGVEERLARMTFPEQFAAVRALHELIRTDGESPDRLAALARGYAHLGVLSEFHWNAAHKAYTARALLLAQRLVAQQPKSAIALWHRAYVRALAGFHQTALDDLAAAQTLAEGKGKVAAPSWVALIDQLCHFETSKLTGAASGRKAQLAMLLAFLTVEKSMAQAQPLELGRALLEENPECFRVHDALCDFGGVANLHRATVIPMQVFSQTIRPRLRQLPGLPQRVVQSLGPQTPETELARALVAAGSSDTGEPSWPVLGRMIQEVRFAQVCRRLHFMRYMWNVPVDDELPAYRTLVADHPYRAFVESFGVDPQHDGARYSKLLDEVSIKDIEITEYPFIMAVKPIDPDAYHRALVHADLLYRDLAALVKHLTPRLMAEYAARLWKASPYAPLARAKLIELDWATAAPHAADWEASAVEQPDVLLALGKQYFSERRWKDVERCLVPSLKLSPDPAAYEMLAKSYREQGNSDRWQQTLDQFLKQPDYGLDHARVRVDIAKYFMEQKQFDKARPYAEAAAQTWAGWAMECAAECYEGLEDWDRAEFWVRNLSERYSNRWAAWFAWCKRLGRGDVDGARAVAAQHVQAVGGGATPDEMDSFGSFYVLSGEPRRALETFQKVTTGNMAVPSALQVAVLADELGDTALRDKTLDRLCGELSSQAPKTIRIVGLFRDALRGGAGAKLDLKAVDEVLESIPSQTRGNTTYFVARFLALHGTRDEAKAYLRQCVDSPTTYVWLRLMAIDTLRGWERSSSNPGQHAAR